MVEQKDLEKLQIIAWSRDCLTWYVARTHTHLEGYKCRRILEVLE